MKKKIISLAIAGAIHSQSLQAPQGVDIGASHNEPWKGKGKRKKKPSP